MRPPKQKQPQVKKGLCRMLEHVDVEYEQQKRPTCHATWLRNSVVEKRCCAFYIPRTTCLETKKKCVDFVAESRGSFYFLQHAAATCNTFFCCKTGCAWECKTGQHRFSTSFAAILRDKLDVFVARITVAFSDLLSVDRLVA